MSEKIFFPKDNAPRSKNKISIAFHSNKMPRAMGTIPPARSLFLLQTLVLLSVLVQVVEIGLIRTFLSPRVFAHMRRLRYQKDFIFSEDYENFWKKGRKWVYAPKRHTWKFPTIQNFRNFPKKGTFLAAILGVPCGCQYHFEAIFGTFFEKLLTKRKFWRKMFFLILATQCPILSQKMRKMPIFA